MTVIINGTTGIDTVQDGIVTDAKLNLTANSQEIKDALNAGGTAPIYACRAWVNFNGTGTVAIRASGNVSSITDNGTGRYQVNLTNSMPDADYCIQVAATSPAANNITAITPNNSISASVTVVVPTSSAFSILLNATNLDSAYVYAAIFR
jgi:hypothetical protein